MRTPTPRSNFWRRLPGPLGAVILGALVFSGCTKAKPTLEQGLEQAIVEATRRHPAHDAKWDPLIQDLTHLYIDALRGVRRDPQRGHRAKQAIDKGCTDPFVRYIWYIHENNYVDRSKDPAFSDEIRAIVDDMQQAAYPPFLRAYVENRAYLLWFYYREKPSPILSKFSRQNWQDVFTAIGDPGTPEWLARDLTASLADLWSRDQARQELGERLDAALTQRYGDCATSHVLHAQHVLDLVRREVYDHVKLPEADDHPDNHSGLAYAQAELELAWKLDPGDPRTAAFMMEVCRYRKLPRAEMEQWFRRALATGRPHPGVALMKLLYLSPEWYGSLEEQLEFARSVRDGAKYGNDSLLLAERAHHEYQEAKELGLDYYARPEVWADLRTGYDAYFARVPDDQRSRIVFARYAWYARDWVKLNEQLDLLDVALVSAERVGGKETLDQMFADARAHRAPETPVKTPPDASRNF